eukprot:Tbor_TRINITY_DN5417_c2_g1::TRINITY_DN5417_c2_g1_i1::g.24987::m.24987
MPKWRESANKTGTTNGKSNTNGFSDCYVPYATPVQGHSGFLRSIFGGLSKGWQKKKNGAAPTGDEVSSMDTGEPLRDFLFDTGGGDALYFSTRDDVCAPLGYYHGQRLLITKGILRGLSVVVIGARGAILYVLFEGEREASPLLNCYTKFDLDAVYGLQELEPKGSVKIKEAALDLTLSSNQSSGKPMSVINFLKYAPDLALEIPFQEDTDDDDDEDDSPSSSDVRPIGSRTTGRKSVREEVCYTVHLTPVCSEAKGGMGAIGWSGEDRIRVRGGGITKKMVKDIIEKQKGKSRSSDDLTNTATTSAEVNGYSLVADANATIVVPSALSQETADRVVFDEIDVNSREAADLSRANNEGLLGGIRRSVSLTSSPQLFSADGDQKSSHMRISRRSTIGEKPYSAAAPVRPDVEEEDGTITDQHRVVEWSNRLSQQLRMSQSYDQISKNAPVQPVFDKYRRKSDGMGDFREGDDGDVDIDDLIEAGNTAKKSRGRVRRSISFVGDDNSQTAHVNEDLNSPEFLRRLSMSQDGGMDDSDIYRDAESGYW